MAGGGASEGPRVVRQVGLCCADSLRYRRVCPAYFPVDVIAKVGLPVAEALHLMEMTV